MNGVQTRLKCKPNVKRCKRFVFAAHSPLLHPNTLKTKAIIHFQTDHILTRFVFPPLEGRNILIENGATLIEVKGIHNKSLAIDNHTLIEGSFNWLSANRHKEYSRHECSIVVSSVQADEYINNLIKELESREKTFQSLSKPTINLDIDQKYPGFFTKESFNDCTEEDICRIKQKVQELGIQKTVLPPYIHKQRETFPRAYEPWCTEEKEIICELMQKTNHLSIFIECLQRTGQAIQIQIEGKNN